MRRPAKRKMGDPPGEAPAAELCAAASATIARVGRLADCTLVAEDGSSYEVSKAIMAAHSGVLG